MNISREYAQALWEYMTHKHEDSKSADSYVEAFIGLLKRRGHYKLLPIILKEFKKIEASKKTKKIGVLTCATTNEVDTFKAKLKQYGISHDTPLVVEIDKNLIGGFTYEGDDVVINGCYRKQLLNLYRKITT
jgi:F0F1-type ATP synthase delta subunit